VRRALLALEKTLDNVLLGHHSLAHGCACLAQQRLSGARGLTRGGDQLHSLITAFIAHVLPAGFELSGQARQ
jgi:hypothetical protein